MSEIKPFTGVDDRVRLADAIPLKAPFTLYIYPSDVCNFKCNYCAQSLGRKGMMEHYGVGNSMMTVETAEIVAQQSKDLHQKYKLISIVGFGEPLCNKQLPEIIKVFKDADIAERIDIITNGSLLTNELTDRLLDSGLDVLRVSLQGINSEAYKRICGVDIDFNEFYNRLSYFYEKAAGKCKVYVKIADVALSHGEEEKFYNMFEGITDRMYIEKIKPVYDMIDYSETQKDMTTDRRGVRHEQRKVCPQPFYVLNILADGEVIPCTALYKPIMLGNVKKISLRDMWEGKLLRDFRLTMLNGGRFTFHGCKRCCAPDDCAHPEDVLDDDIEKIVSLLD